MKKNTRIKTLVTVGAGNVAWHLTRALYGTGIKVLQVCAPRLDQAAELARKVEAVFVDRCDKINPSADLYLLAVPDGKIREVAGSLPDVKGMVCHTSGITPLDVLHRFEKRGVFYPLQTFSKNRRVDLLPVPFCLEGDPAVVLPALREIAERLSGHVYEISSEKRAQLHLAAVLVNNFSNHLFDEAENYLTQNGMNRSMLFPLMHETVNKLQDLPAREAQTGPARRGDYATIAKHLEMLTDKPHLKEIYQFFSQQILKKYHE